MGEKTGQLAVINYARAKVCLLALAFDAPGKFWEVLELGVWELIEREFFLAQHAKLARKTK